MNEPKITTLSTIYVMNETTLLLGNMASACDFISRNISEVSDNVPAANTSGIFGVLSYAAEAAHEKQSEYESEFMTVCGFTYPVFSTANQKNETVIPFPSKSG